MTGFVPRLARRVPLVEQELHTLLVFSGVRVTRSLVVYVCFVDRCLSFYTFSFDPCVVCSSSIYVSVCPFGIFKLFLGISSAPFDKYYNEHKSVKNCTLIKRFNGILNNTGALCTSFVLSQFFLSI